MEKTKRNLIQAVQLVLEANRQLNLNLINERDV